MEQHIDKNCCCCGPDNNQNCIICGKTLIYFQEEKMLECRICHKFKPANACCEDGHFVCDDCHVGGGAPILDYLLCSKEKDPIALYIQVCNLSAVHLHGPEHHSIVPCVLMTTYHNCGGDIEFEECLQEAWARGRKVPGGACGFLGVCGAAAGAGIFASIVSEASPLTEKEWEIPQRLTANCLNAMVKVGGPRCCKRTGRIAIECAAKYSEEVFGVRMSYTTPKCTFSARNKECLHQRCPFFNPEEQETGGTADS